MDSEPGRSLIVWTVRASVAFYCCCLWLKVGRRSPAADRQYAIFWAASCALCVVHVLLAYHYEHRWSQAAALQHTAELTDKVVGVYWSGGLYINYLFLAIWAADVLKCFQRHQPSGTGMQVVTAFMMFNATVVFGPRWWVIAFVLLALVLCMGHYRSRPRPV
ncbi:MAG: hypothetical protein NXI04_08345 [Planctomycetaceae bacterium]|nr:hypothetical protein [Planctomycetaceae bacterium]